MPNFRELLKEAKSEIDEITTEEAEKLISDDWLVLDVREPDEYEQGAIASSLHIPRGNLESSIEGVLPERNTKIIAMCAGGARSAFAAQTLQNLDYSNVVSMKGGFNQWKDENRSWILPQTLNSEKRNRYQRHLLLPEIGDEGQMKLLDSKVFTEVNIPLIADQAECSVPSIYNHFPGALPEIFEEVAMRIRTEGFQVNQEKIDQASGLQILEELLRGLCETIVSHRNLSHAMISYGNYAAATGGWMPDTAEYLEPLFERAGEDEELTASPRALAQMTSVIGRGLNHYWALLGISDEEYKEQFARSAEMAVKALS